MFDKKKFKILLAKAIDDKTISDFSKESNVNRTYLSKYMNEKLDSPPSPEILKSIANSTNKVTYKELMIAAGYLESNEKINESADKIKSALAGDPELAGVWDKLSKRPDLQLLFKQTKDMSPRGVKQVIRIIKAIEEEERERLSEE